MAMGINDLGIVVGGTNSDYHGTQPPAFTRYPNGKIQIFRYHDLYTTFNRRNSQGVTIGSYQGPAARGVPDGHVHGIVIYGSQVATFNYPNASDTFPQGINKWGTIVGSYKMPGSNHEHGFKYTNGKFYSIDYPNAVDTTIASINDDGVMVGAEYTGSGVYEGFLRTKEGKFTAIKDPKATGATFPSDINNTGTIVGDYIIGLNPQPFLYSNGTFKDINVPNARPYGEVEGINDHNEVAGQVFTNDGSSGFIAQCH